jgi:autotransporter-associated beta strand protein
MAAASRWAAPVSGNWSIGSNWITGSVPNGVGASATINQPIPTNRTITVDTPATVGTLTLGNSLSSAGYTLAGPGPLTFDNSGSGAMLNVTDGYNNVINIPLVLGDNLTVSCTGVCRINGNVSDSGASRGITLDGGLLTLSGSNSFTGDTNVGQGELLATSSASIPSGSSLILGNGAPYGNSQAVLYLGPSEAFGKVEIDGGLINTAGALIVTTSSFRFVPAFPIPGEIGTLGVPEYGDNAINDALLEGEATSANGVYVTLPISGDGSVGWFDNSSGSYTVFEGVPINTSQSVIYGIAPEPSTLALISAGAIGLAAYAWRRRRHDQLTSARS